MTAARGVPSVASLDVALLTPTGGDARLAARILAKHRIATRQCTSMTELCGAIAQGVGALLVAEEALVPADRAALLACLEAQSGWSDVPVVLLVSQGELSGPLSNGARDVARRGNVTLLERPVRVATLATTLGAALRARARQYEMRDVMNASARSMRELEESERRLNAAVEAAPYPLMVHTHDGEIVHLSRTWCELTGYRREQLTTIGAWTKLAYGDEARDALEVIAADQASERAAGVSAPIWEHEVRTSSGARRLWSFHSAPLGRMSDGRRLRLVAAVDVTEMRRLLENERALRGEAEEANKAKMKFLATMSHELRTPLNAIGGHVQLMELEILGPVTPRQAEALRRVRRAEAHLLGLINDVLNFAKIEAGHITVRLSDFTVGELFEGMDDLIQPQVQSKGLTYGRATDCDGVRITGDAEKARQVVLNLLSNAIKFTEPGGAIGVECVCDAQRAHLRVKDTGIGIAVESLPAIFEPFVQVRSEYTATNQGTGLGLAISRDLAVAMHGDLSVESAPGRGSVFILSLPLAPAAR